MPSSGGPGFQRCDPKLEPICGEQTVVHACGVDIVELEEISHGIELAGERFLARIYTPGELAFCKGRIAQLAARFAAKEAVSKALGTGIRGIHWRDIEVVSTPQGQPLLQLSDRAALRAAELGLSSWSLSLSHSSTSAIAVVVAVG